MNIILFQGADSQRAPAKAVKYDVGELKDGTDGAWSELLA